MSPYEPWTDVAPDRRRAMKANKRRDTAPELALRRELHGRGMRYRVDKPIALAGRRPVRPDIVFARTRLAVFCDGCYWHGCPIHGSLPTTRREYWEAKIRRNVERDREVDQALQAEGWTVVHAWEHDAPAEVADRIEAVLDWKKK